ncbi:MAG: class I SAM-dependent methyltransferase [Leptolinea sp.]|nr:class I SAM-dependent methyltransferase [Leptolinea sp.]
MCNTPNLHQRFLEQARWTEQAQRLLFETTELSVDSTILEVGCGTGALLTSLNRICPAKYSGIDLQLDLLKFASIQQIPFSLSCADALHLPFNNGSFDAVVCHFFLLWVSNPEIALIEMQRVTRSGGFIALLAEPDYGSRIDFPDDFVTAGAKQRDSLIRQGANPDIGRSIADLMVRRDCQNVSWGILGSYQKKVPEKEHTNSEMEIFKSDLSGILDEVSIEDIIKKETQYRLSNSRVQFIPTFYAFGMNP